MVSKTNKPKEEQKKVDKKDISVDFSSYTDISHCADSLGMESRYNGIAEFILKCGTPMTIAIQGDWGIGKTSAMNNIKDRLNATNNAYPCLWFNTWQFSVLSEGKELFKEFLLCILSELSKILPNNKKNEFINKLTELSKFSESIGAVMEGAGQIFLPVGIIHSVSKLICSVISKAGSNDIAEATYSETMWIKKLCDIIDQYMKEAVDNYKTTANADNAKFCIFIDDLDRLEPQRAVELLECIKNFMEFKNCVFILAIDQKVVNQGLAKKYGTDFLKKEEGETRTKAEKFFDKIIQVPFLIPEKSFNLKTFMEDNLSAKDKEKADSYAWLLKRFDIYNPRCIKRYLNLCSLYICMDTSKTNDVSHFCLFSMVVFKSEYENEYIKFADEIMINNMNPDLFENNSEMIDECGEHAGIIIDAFKRDEKKQTSDVEQIIKMLGYDYERNQKYDNVKALISILDGINISEYENIIDRNDYVRTFDLIKAGKGFELSKNKCGGLKISYSPTYERLILKINKSENTLDSSQNLNEKAKSDFNNTYYYTGKTTTSLYFGNSENSIKEVVEFLQKCGI